MSRLKDMDWWYWLLTDCMLLVYLAGWPPVLNAGIQPVIALTIIQTVHYFTREKRIAAFPVQVRLAYLFLLVAGSYPPLVFIHWIQLIGTTAMITDNYCPLARIMSLMPWNRSRTLTLELLWNTFVMPPVQGSIVDQHREPS